MVQTEGILAELGFVFSRPIAHGFRTIVGIGVRGLMNRVNAIHGSAAKDMDQMIVDG